MRRTSLFVIAASIALALGCERRRVLRMPSGGEIPPLAANDGGSARPRDGGDDAGLRTCPGRVEPFDALELQLEPIHAVDILFVVDDSSTMGDEQVQLANEFEGLLANLTRAVTPHALRSVHLGVISADLGLQGVTGVTGCEGAGMDGLLQHASSDDGACARRLPTFVSFAPAAEDFASAAVGLACLTELGTGGCGLQQPLEAAFKALNPADHLDVNGHASDANLGFARATANQERSVLAVVVVSDKDDCSLQLPETWAAGASFDASDDGLRAQQLNVRCAQRAEERTHLVRYAPALGLPIDADQQLVFAAITGIPRFTNATERLLSAGDDDQRAAIYAELLADPRMQNVVDDRGNDLAEDDTLTPVCEGNQGQAWPAPRLVEMAQRTGRNAIVGSICDNDYSEIISGVRRRIAERLVGPCLEAPLRRERDGLVACDLVWHLPPGGAPAQGPSSCDDPRFPFLAPDHDPLGSAPFDPDRCRVLQLPVAVRAGELAVLPAEHDGELLDEGWFYDDFSGDTSRQCGAFPRRVALESRAQPDRSVRISLQCLQRATDPDPANCLPRR